MGARWVADRPDGHPRAPGVLRPPPPLPRWLEAALAWAHETAWVVLIVCAISALVGELTPAPPWGLAALLLPAAAAMLLPPTRSRILTRMRDPRGRIVPAPTDDIDR